MRTPRRKPGATGAPASPNDPGPAGGVRPRDPGGRTGIKVWTLILLTIRSILLDRKTVVVGAVLTLLLVIPAAWLHYTPDEQGDDTDVGADGPGAGEGGDESGAGEGDPPQEEDGAGQENGEEEIGPAMDVFMTIMVFVYLQFLVLYVCFLYASGTITTEMDEKTMTYLIARPLGKHVILGAKYIGLVVSIFLLFSIPAVINYLLLAGYRDPSGVSGNTDLLVASLGGILLAVTMWTALFMFMASVFRNPLMPGFLYCLFWETTIANVGTNISRLTVTYQVRTFILQWIMRTREYLQHEDDLPVHGEYPPGSAFLMGVIAATAFLVLAWNAFRTRDIT